MNKLTIQQGIFLSTNNTFSKKEWCEKEMTEGGKQLSQIEQLEEACWHGLLGELLPEIVEKPGYGKKLFLWQIRQGKSALHIQLSESSVQIDKHNSIDPCFFLRNLLLNN
jgi:hypothetical protein